MIFTNISRIAKIVVTRLRSSVNSSQIYQAVQYQLVLTGLYPTTRPICSAMLSRSSKIIANPSDKTSAIEGYSLGELEKIWKDLTASEMRLRMMDRLQRYKVGFNDVENFNLGLIYNSKTLTYDNYTEKDDKKVVEMAMKFKRKDEVKNRKKIIKEKLMIRKRIETEMTMNQGKKLLKHLNGTAMRKKEELVDKYDRKIEHLRKKFEVDKEKDLDKISEEMRGEGFEELSVFCRDKFEKVKKTEISVVKYGDIEIDSDEEAALKLHPKMALPKKLTEGYMNLALDISYTKVRWQLKKDEEMKEPSNEGGAAIVENDKDTAKKRKKEEDMEVEEAKARMVYDPENKVYDERKLRVTDLAECSRIFLPKPLEVNQEAQLEMRREIHTKVCENFRKEKCDEKGRQERTLSNEELRGLRKLEKRKQDGEVVVIMTDKSSKLCIMKREDYLKLGEEHVGKDREIERPELVRREKTLNQHSMSWIKMWRTGQDHDHEDRIRQSKISNSENRADLYLTYKDHKKVPGKTRPIATGCTSNSLALSNSVSSLVESLANSETNKHEVISTEDLLHNAKKHDKIVEKMRKDRKIRILRRIKCLENHGHDVDDEEEDLQVPHKAVGNEEQPGWSNFLPSNPQLQGFVYGGRRAYYEPPHGNSNAHHNAGLLPGPGEGTGEGEDCHGTREERNHYLVPHIPGVVDQEERRRWSTWKLEI